MAATRAPAGTDVELRRADARPVPGDEPRRRRAGAPAARGASTSSGVPDGGWRADGQGPGHRRRAARRRAVRLPRRRRAGAAAAAQLGHPRGPRLRRLPGQRPVAGVPEPDGRSRGTTRRSTARPRSARRRCRCRTSTRASSTARRRCCSGPTPGFSTKFLKQGSYFDLPYSVRPGQPGADGHVRHPQPVARQVPGARGAAVVRAPLAGAAGVLSRGAGRRTGSFAWPGSACR